MLGWLAVGVISLYAFFDSFFQCDYFVVSDAFVSVVDDFLFYVFWGLGWV